MEAATGIVHRILPWAFAACCAAALWIAGYYGGRSDGRETGYVAGLLPAPEGIASGRAEAVQEIIDRSSSRPPSQEVYDVRALIAERLGKKPGDPTNMNEINDAMVEIADEIYRDVGPEAEFGSVESGFVVRGFSTAQIFCVRAEARRHAELGVYLKSKDDYLAWRQDQNAVSRPNARP